MEKDKRRLYTAAAMHCAKQSHLRLDAKEIGELEFNAEDDGAELIVRFVKDDGPITKASPTGVHTTLYVVFETARPLMSLNALQGSDAGIFENLTINRYVLDLYQRTASTILEVLAEHMTNASIVDDNPFQRTVFTGQGVGACIAAALATQSPPNALLLYGMPPFANDDIEERILDLVDSRKDRMLEMGHESVDFELASFEDATDSAVSDVFYSPYKRMGTVYYWNGEGKLTVNPSWLRRFLNKPGNPLIPTYRHYMDHVIHFTR